MKQNWTYKKFEDCICKVPKAKQVQTSAYKDGTKYPIISQEDKLISGYCDDESMLFRIDRPVVIFGDHTRVLKYIDFNFVVGADGVKILLPKDFLEAKFLIYYLRWYNVPSLGYSRHYKLLKEIKIPLPPLSTQQSIIAELDEINNLLSLKRKELDAYDKLAQSLFYEMFGDPVDNEKGWEVKKLGEVCPVVVDGVHSKPNYTSEGKPFVSVVNINKGKLNLTDCKFVSEEDFLLMTKKNKAEKGDILYSKVGATYGIPALVDSDVDFALYVSVCLIKPNHKHINSIFLVEMMRSPFIKYQADRRIRGIGVPDLHLNQIRAFNVILPPLSLQQTFATRIEAIEVQKANVKAAIEKLETLLAARMQYWFE